MVRFFACKIVPLKRRSGHVGVVTTAPGGEIRENLLVQLIAWNLGHIHLATCLLLPELRPILEPVAKRAFQYQDVDRRALGNGFDFRNSIRSFVTGASWGTDGSESTRFSPAASA